MSDPPTPPRLTPPTDAAAEGVARARALLEEQMAALKELGEIGMGIARALGRQAEGLAEGLAEGEESAPVADGDVGLAFGRVSRAVRLTFMLQTQTLKDIAALDAPAAAGEAAWRPDYGVGQQAAQREALRQIVGRVILEQHDEIDAIERVARECREILDRESLKDELLDNPVSTLVAMICWNLGLSPDWSRLIEEPWAQAEIASGAPGENLLYFMREREREKEIELVSAEPPDSAHPRAGGDPGFLSSGDPAPG